jgi:hypothetical protein
MFFTGFSPEGNCVASVITHLRIRESRRNAQDFPLVSSAARSSRKSETSETPVADSPAIRPGLLLCKVRRLTMQYKEFT